MENKLLPKVTVGMTKMEIKDIITLAGILVSLILGSLGIIIGIRNSKKTIFINSVTAMRAKWIDTVRDSLSEFCGLAHQIHYTKEQRMPRMDRIQQLRFLIKLRLNPKDDYDKKLMVVIDDIVKLLWDEKIAEASSKIDELVRLSQHLLKLEWEGVKEESKKGDLSKKNKRRLYNKHLRGDKTHE